MKRVIAVLLVLVLSLGVFAGCNSGGKTGDDNGGGKPSAGKVTTLNVFTTYAGNDGNAENYQTAIKDYENETGNTINDSSATAEETVKAKIRTDFSSGSEPDVLFYFTGADADTFLDKVVTVEEVRKEYPDFAKNMNEELVPYATDGKWYSVPMKGYWENMFVNKTVLKEAGVDIPPADYTWDAFLEDCAKIKEAGFTPIAASFVDVPHYWWEFSIFNNDTPSTHLDIPASTTDAAGKAWVDGMQDIKDLYELGFFPDNVLSEQDEALQELLYNDKAAFMIDGSWRANTVKARCEDADGNIDEAKLENFTVVNVPAKSGGRKSTDLITGMSSGWYITKKVWEDEDKRNAAVNFVEYMTTDEMVTKFAGMEATALKNGVQVDEATMDSLDKDIVAMLKNMTSSTPAVQDIVAGDARNAMFQAIPQMVSGSITPEQLVQDFLDSFAKE